MRTNTGQTIKLKNYREPDYWAKEVDLDFDLHPNATIVTSTVRYVRNKNAKSNAVLLLSGDELKFISAELDGRPLAASQYVVSEDQFTLLSPPKSGKFSLTLVTEINPSANTKLMGLYRSSGVYTTQCEAEGFRRITYYLDRPDVLAVFTTRIEADKKAAPLLLGNGNKVKQGKLKNGRHYAVWHDPHPKPAYLFALVGGDLDGLSGRFKTRSGKNVALNIYVEKGKADQSAYAMDALKRSMKWDEEVFGCEYDLDVFNIVAVSDFNMGAMENKGLNIFNDKYVLADQETATDVDFYNIERIIAHEYFHNWTGNRITCRDWFQLCLKEGLTVFRDQEFTSDMRSRAVYRIDAVEALKARQFPEDQGPLAHPVRPAAYKEINNFYTATVYEKGSELVRMIMTILGEKQFRKGISLYLKRHDGDAATIEDFIKSFENACKCDLSQFARWYTQAGTPTVTVGERHDAGKKQYVLTLEQKQQPTPDMKVKKPLHIPLRFGLLASDGSEISNPSVSKIKGANVVGDTIHFTAKKAEITIGEVAARPTLSINRGFSAPVELSIKQSDKALAHLAQYDADLFNRHDALQRFAMKVIRAKMRKPKAAIDPAFLHIMVATATDAKLEPAYRAASLLLPSEDAIAQEIGRNIDPEPIHKARIEVMKTVGEALSASLKGLLATCETGTTYSPAASDAGKRSLKWMLLAMAVKAELPGYLNKVERLFKSADNMTNQMAALRIIVNSGDEKKAQRALNAFHKRFKDNPLVIDKWLMVQAMAPGRSTLANVKKLMKHPSFDIENPNRARSLIGVYAAGNATGFNRKDGAGYRFFAEQIIRFDKRNPQLAARLLTIMNSWKKLEPGRRKHAKAALSTIAWKKNLSTDTREIIDRILA